MAGLQIESLLLIICLLVCVLHEVHSGSREFRIDSTASLLKTRGGAIDDDLGKSNLVLGKDRVLLQVNVDLKGIVNRMSDRQTWVKWGRAIEDFFISLQLIPRDSLRYMKQIVIEMLSDIRSYDTRSKLKCFVGSVEEAALYALKRGCLLVLYVEDGDCRYPSMLSTSYREVFADPVLGNYLNSNCVFLATTNQHRATKKYLKSIGITEAAEYPVFAILNPMGDQESIPLDDKTVEQKMKPTLLSKLLLPRKDLTPQTVQRYIERVAYDHDIEHYSDTMDDSVTVTIHEP